MKKILFLIVAVSTGFVMQAQESSFGPSIGANYAWLSDLDNTSGRPSYNIGLTYTHSIIENVGFGLDLRYSEEGTRQEVTGVELTTKLNYVRLPVKFIYFFGQIEDDFRPKLFAGPTLGFLVGGKSQLRTETGTNEVASKDYFEGFDMGMNFGAGFNYRLAEATWLNFGVAYTHGFINVVKSGPEAFNRNVNVNLGIAWGF
ncbi:MAG TPA: porin family protein [Saprospiraceae bacterium]|nr:porin family protein [Saprospiraceae bacterium]